MNKVKVIIATLIAFCVTATVLLIPSAANAAFNGCDITASYLPGDVSNGLTFAYSTGAFYTPMRRAGDCRHVYVQYLGTYQGPTCAHAKVNTYNEDRSIRIEGPWVTFFTVGPIYDLRPTIDVGRLYRIHIRNCNPDYRRNNSNGSLRPGMNIWAQ